MNITSILLIVICPVLVAYAWYLKMATKPSMFNSNGRFAFFGFFGGVWGGWGW